VTLLLFGPAYSAVQEQVPAEHRASAVAVLLFCGALLGGAFGSAAVGWLADTFIAAGLHEPLTMAILIVQTVVAHAWAHRPHGPAFRRGTPVVGCPSGSLGRAP